MAREIIPRANGEQSREAILAVAERLFADQGFDRTSLRQVGAEADVPFALASYHFKGKLGLYKAVFARRAASLYTERHEKLLAIRMGQNPAENFAAIARAFVEPLLRERGTKGGQDFMRLLAREINDPVEGARGIVAEYFDPLAQEVVALLQAAAPGAPRHTVYWAYHFATGALAINKMNVGRIERLSGGLCSARNLDQQVEELIRFITNGFVGCLRPDMSAPPCPNCVVVPPSAARPRRVRRTD